MARRRTFTSQLYRAARISNNISAIASGNPRRVARRAKNVALGRGGFWRWLWKHATGYRPTRSSARRAVVRRVQGQRELTTDRRALPMATAIGVLPLVACLTTPTIRSH
jgi:hypothetical protein